MPKEWAVAADGAATTDPKLGLLGTQTVFGGHKGSALALLVELLGSALSGTDLAIEGGASSEAGGMNRGLMLIAIDPTRQSPEVSDSVT